MKIMNTENKQSNIPISEIVRQTLTELDFEKLKPIKQSDFWIDQFKAIVNLTPFAGGAIAQEVQNFQNYKAAEFFRKFTAYIYNLELHTANERMNFCNEIEEKAQDYSGNVIMGMVDRLDNIHKQGILANLTNAKINGLITIEDMFRLSSMLERIPYVDLTDLLKYSKPFYDESGNTELLFATGVLRFAYLDGVNDSNKYVLSAMGQKLVKYGMRLQVDVQFDGLQIELPTMTDEDIHEITSKFKLPEEERRAIIEEARPKWERS